MADVNLQVQINLLENINQTLKGLNTSFDKFSSKASDSFSQVGKGAGSTVKAFNAISLGVIAVNQSIELLSKAYNAFIPLIKQSINEAAKQEEVESLLANSMKQRGIFTEEAYKQNLKLADSIQKLSTYQDDEILNAERILIQLGTEQSQLESVTKATLDFAKAKGIELSSAAEIVAKSIGTTNNALSRYGIQIDNTLKGTARATTIVNELNRVFGGTSAAAVNTFSGSIKQLSNTYAELLEQIGNYVVKNPFVIAAIKEATILFTQLIDIVSKNRESMTSLVNEGLIALVDGFASLIGALGALGPVIFGIVNIFDGLKIAVLGVLTALSKFVNLFVKLGKAVGYQSAVTRELESVNNFLNDSLKESIVKLNKDKKVWDKNISVMNEAKNKVEEFSKSLKKINENKEIVVKQKQIVETTAVTSIYDNIISAFKIGSAAFVDSFKSLKLEDVVSSIGAGKAGGQKLMKGAITAAATAALGPAGGPVGEVAGILGMDPAEFSKTINGFIEGLVDFIPNIAKNIPTLIRAIVAGIPEFIRGLNEALPILIDGLVEMLSDPAFWSSVIDAIIQMALYMLGNPNFWIGLVSSFIKAIVKGVPAIVGAMIKAVTDTFTKPFEKLGKIFSDVGNIFKTILEGLKQVAGTFTGGGLLKKIPIVGNIIGGISKGIGGALKGVGKVFGFQHGGEVPTNSLYANDRFGPVMLSKGENVMTESLNRRMANFLDAEESKPRTMVVNLQVGEKDLAGVMLALNQRGFRTA